jgi:hypothetical protein
MDLLKRKIKSWDFTDSSEWKINRCASKYQRKLIKKMYRRLKRSVKGHEKREIKRYLDNEC